MLSQPAAAPTDEGFHYSPEMLGLLGAGVKVFHGANEPFEQFNPKLIGTRTDPGFAGRGAYTTTSESVANRWGPHVMSTEIPEGKNWLQIKGISDLYTKHGVPELTLVEKQLPQQQLMKVYEQRMTEFTDRMKQLGYDGVKWPMSSGETQYILFHPETYKFTPIKK